MLVGLRWCVCCVDPCVRALECGCGLVPALAHGWTCLKNLPAGYVGSVRCSLLLLPSVTCCWLPQAGYAISVSRLGKLAVRIPPVLVQAALHGNTLPAQLQTQIVDSARTGGAALRVCMGDGRLFSVVSYAQCWYVVCCACSAEQPHVHMRVRVRMCSAQHDNAHVRMPALLLPTAAAAVGGAPSPPPPCVRRHHHWRHGPDGR